MKFDLLTKDLQSQARAGTILTDHGVIETPIFMPVGTAGSVKGVHQRELIDDIKAQGESIIKIIEMNNSEWRDLSEVAYMAVRKSTWENSINQFERILTEPK